MSISLERLFGDQLWFRIRRQRLSSFGGRGRRQHQLCGLRWSFKRQRLLGLGWLSILLLGLQFATTLYNSISDLSTEQTNGPNSVIIGGNGIIHLIGIAVGIGQRDNRNFQATSF